MSKTRMRSEEALRIEVTVIDDRAVCTLRGELDSESAAPLRTVLAEQLEAGHDVLVDLAAVTFIDSSGLGVLAGALKRFQATGHHLRLHAPTPPIRRVLDMTGLANAFGVE
jgi:anti-anti-sigma factor